MRNLSNILLLDMCAENAYQHFSYPAGEIQVRLNEEVVKDIENEKNGIAVIANIDSPESLIKTILYLNAVEGCIPESELTLPKFLILPYLPYSRADRRFVKGDTLGKQAFLNMLPANWDNITFDIHSDKIEQFNLFNVTPEKILEKIFKNYSFDNILFPDAGAMSRYSNMIEKMNIPANIYFCQKQRDPVTGQFLGFEVPTVIDKTKNTIIIDDLCDGGGTFIGIADKLQMDRSKLALYVSHGIFSKGLEGLSKYFGTILTTNSWTKFLDNYNNPRGEVVLYSVKESMMDKIFEILENEFYSSQTEF